MRNAFLIERIQTFLSHWFSTQGTMIRQKTFVLYLQHVVQEGTCNNIKYKTFIAIYRGVLWLVRFVLSDYHRRQWHSSLQNLVFFSFHILFWLNFEGDIVSIFSLIHLDPNLLFHRKRSPTLVLLEDADVFQNRIVRYCSFIHPLIV